MVECSRCKSENVTAASGNVTTWYCLKCGHYWTTEGSNKKYDPEKELDDKLKEANI